jgi:hypothetical protein
MDRRSNATTRDRFVATTSSSRWSKQLASINEGYTLSIALHPHCILALIQIILSDDLDLAIFRHQRPLGILHLE